MVDQSDWLPMMIPTTALFAFASMRAEKRIPQ